MEEIGKCKKKMFHEHSVSDVHIFEEAIHVHNYDPGLNGISISLDGHL